MQQSKTKLNKIQTICVCNFVTKLSTLAKLLLLSYSAQTCKLFLANFNESEQCYSFTILVFA